MPSNNIPLQPSNPLPVSSVESAAAAVRDLYNRVDINASQTNSNLTDLQTQITALVARVTKLENP